MHTICELLNDAHIIELLNMWLPRMLWVPASLRMAPTASWQPHIKHLKNT
jgi:hypothetical protein